RPQREHRRHVLRLHHAEGRLGRGRDARAPRAARHRAPGRLARHVSGLPEDRYCPPRARARPDYHPPGSRRGPRASHRGPPAPSPADRSGLMANPGGYASKAERAVRADKVKRLYEEGLTCTDIARRLGIHPSTAAETATKLGLREPRGKKFAS